MPTAEYTCADCGRTMRGYAGRQICPTCWKRRAAPVCAVCGLALDFRMGAESCNDFAHKGVAAPTGWESVGGLETL